MSETASMILMSSPSSAISVGEPDCDEPPEPPNLINNINNTNNNKNNSNNSDIKIINNNHSVINSITPYTITMNDNGNGVGHINDDTDITSSIIITPIDTNINNHGNNGNDIDSDNNNTNLSAHIIVRRASNSSISSDDDSISSSNGNGSISPLSSSSGNIPNTISNDVPLSLPLPPLVIGTHHVASSTSVYDTYESKEMKIRYDPRMGMGMAASEIKDVSILSSPLLPLSHKCGGEDEHKEETNMNHSHEFKEVEGVNIREEKKQIVMLATAMLDDSHSADKQIAFNLGKLEMVADLSHTLEGLGHCVRSELVSHKNIDDVVNHIKPTELVFNLCDGTDDDGVVGVSLVNKLEERRLAFTGACSAFYTISSAKSRMKACFEGARVPTMPYRVIAANEDPAIVLANGPAALNGHLESLKQWPLFVKPDDAYGSMGISDACVCRNQDELLAQCDAMRKSGFKRLMVEGFLDGDEFSVLMTDVRTYTAVRKVYLREGALCLDFKADWIDNSYEMVPVDDTQLDDRLRAVAQSAYISVAGNSYARVDLRIHRSTGTICVLEVNSQPGIGDNSTAWDVLIGYASRSKLSKGYVTAQFLQDIVTHPRRGLLPLGITVDNVPHNDPE